MAARYSLQGKTVLITGAARGIGAEVARQAAGRGARVSCVGLEPEELERVAHACGSDAMWFEADVTDLDSLERAVAGTVERSGGIDVVVANAGVASTGSVRHLPVDAFERVIDVNVLGVYRTVRTCLPHVLDRRGYVLCMASLAAIVPSFPGFSAYATSKAAVEAFGMSLRPEVEHLGVDVGVAFLSWFATDLVRGADAEHPAFKLQRERLSWPVNKTHPLPDAGKAIVRGIERRSPVVAAPRWVGPARYLRGVLLPITQRQIASDAPEVMALMEAEYQRAGAAAARPVGAGGAADARASGARLS